jgi:DNA-binding transcriptional LysR family regulator
MPTMDLSQLRYVVAAAEAGNFARAAEALRLNTSTISRRVGRLEDELSVTLFERGPAGVRLPPIGETLEGLLSKWRKLHPKTSLTIAELPDRDIVTAIEERRLDVPLLPRFMLWPHAEVLPLQAARELHAAFLGSSMRFQAHAVSKQSILELVSAGFVVTLAVSSQSEVKFPGVVYKAIGEPNAWLCIDLAWMPETDQPAVGRFVAFMRNEARSKRLL